MWRPRRVENPSAWVLLPLPLTQKGWLGRATRAGGRPYAFVGPGFGPVVHVAGAVALPQGVWRQQCFAEALADGPPWLLPAGKALPRGHGLQQTCQAVVQAGLSRPRGRLSPRPCPGARRHACAPLAVIPVPSTQLGRALRAYVGPSWGRVGGAGLGWHARGPPRDSAPWGTATQT